MAVDQFPRQKLSATGLASNSGGPSHAVFPAARPSGGRWRIGFLNPSLLLHLQKYTILITLVLPYIASNNLTLCCEQVMVGHHHIMSLTRELGNNQAILFRTIFPRVELSERTLTHVQFPSPTRDNGCSGCRLNCFRQNQKTEIRLLYGVIYYLISAVSQISRAANPPNAVRPSLPWPASPLSCKSTYPLTLAWGHGRPPARNKSSSGGCATS